MITQYQNAWAVALGAMLVLAGCSSSSHVVGHRAVGMRAVGPALTLTIVESSPNFRAEAHDMAAMRDEVMKYLSSQGLDRNGDYYVRVDLQPKNPGDPAEWAIVKLTNANTSTYTLLGADTAIGPDDYYPYSFAYGSPYYDAYNYWGPDYGYYGPTYVNPAFYRPTPRRHDGDRDGDRRPGDRDRDRDRDRNPNDQPRSTRDHQPNDHTRNWNGRDRDRDPNGRKDGGNWRDHRPDRPETPNRPGGDRPFGDRPRWSGSGGTRPESAPPSSAGGFSRAAPSQNYAPASHASSPAASYSPPPAPAYSPPPAPAPSAPARGDPSPTRNDRNQER
ncbi:MAG TPA: hypothetical protein VL200_14110 [Lacunisphaera sp.]|jgi:hypothetical protein|nr:hypothetical protein [Lacunisphaera sp.]